MNKKWGLVKINKIKEEDLWAYIIVEVGIFIIIVIFSWLIWNFLYVKNKEINFYNYQQSGTWIKIKNNIEK